MMFSRNNIFSSNSGGNNSFSNNRGSYNNSYSNSNSNNYGGSHNNSQGRGIGSQRLDYKYQQPPSYLTASVTQWKEYPPASIVCRQQTMHLSTTELRIEDYFLIRKRQLSSQLQDKIRTAIRLDSFNEELIRIDVDKLPPVSDDRPLDFDAIRGRGGNNSSGYNSGSHSGSNNGYNTRGGSSSGNIFGNSNGSNSINHNIFSQNSRGGSSGNIFTNDRGGNNSYGNNSGSGNSIFNSNRSGSGNNIFNSSNNNNNSRGSNIFGNNSGNSGGNIFSNNNNNRNGSSNIFGNNSNNNTNNIFNNNRGGSNNIFNNSNNGGGNNIFNNRSNGGNSLFSNSNNNNNNNGVSNQFMASLHYLFEQNNKIMQTLSAKLVPDQQPTEIESNPSPLDTIMGKDPFDIENFLNEPRRRAYQQPIIVAQAPWMQDYKNLANSQILGQSKLVRSTRRVSNVTSSKITNNHIGSQILNNQPTITGSRLISSHLSGPQIKNTSSRLLNKSDQNISINGNKRPIIRSNAALLQWSGECFCDIQLDVQWTDDVCQAIPPMKIRGKLQLPNLFPNDLQWSKDLVSRLKQENSQVRLDACINITFTKELQTDVIGYQIRGILKQKIANLSSDYKVCYSQIRNGMLYNLVISNSFGSIAWQRPINLKQLDFAMNEEIIPFQINQNTIVCELQALNSKCRVSFVGLPEQYERRYGQNSQMDWQMKEKFAQDLYNKFNGAFQLIDMWKDKSESGWSMLVNKFPQINDQNE